MDGGIKAISGDKKKGHKNMDKLLLILVYLIPFLVFLAAVGFVSDRVENRSRKKRAQHGRRAA